MINLGKSINELNQFFSENIFLSQTNQDVVEKATLKLANRLGPLFTLVSICKLRMVKRQTQESQKSYSCRGMRDSVSAVPKRNSAHNMAYTLQNSSASAAGATFLLVPLPVGILNKVACLLYVLLQFQDSLLVFLRSRTSKGIAVNDVKEFLYNFVTVDSQNVSIIHV